MTGRRFLGVDLGATKLLAHVVDEAGRSCATLRRPTGRTLGPDAAVALVAEVAAELARDAGPFDGVGVGFPGLTDGPRGVALSSVMLEGWQDVPLAGRLSERLALPCFVDNDVNNAARAELALRRAEPDWLFVAVGTGIGGALVLDGRVFPGASGLAGEVGHVAVADAGPRCRCGRIACVNLFASGEAIEARLSLGPGELARAAAEAGPREAAAFRDAGRALGSALASVLNVLNLPRVVLGGGVVEGHAAFLSGVEEAARGASFPEIAAACRFEKARAGWEAGAVGSALLAREGLAQASCGAATASRSS